MRRQPTYAVARSNDNQRRWGLAVLLLMLGALLTACGGESAVAPSADASVDLAAVLADPDRYSGERLTLSGEVSEALSNRAFRIESVEGLVDVDNAGPGLLVLVADAADEPVDIDNQTNVEVIGELQRLDLNSLPEGIGAEFNFAVNGVADGDLVLLAEEILVQAEIGRIDNNPGAYLDNVVTVSGEVAEVLREGIVRLEGADGDDVLVLLGDTASSAARAGQELTVTGEVRQFRLEDLEREFGFDLDAGIFAGWENRALIVADSIRER